jgi:Do/DeqQ family serine protease
MRLMATTSSMLVALLVSACDQPAPSVRSQQSFATSGPSPTVDVGRGRAAPASLAPMLAKVTPAVVNISVTGTQAAMQNSLLADPFFRQFFDVPENQQPALEKLRAAGSGVIYDAANGLVLTNNHLIEHADEVLVTLKDRRQLKATVVAGDAKTDVAVLRIQPDRLTSLPLGDSKTLHVGDYVVAIGNAFGVGQTATFGIISALGRSGLGIESYEDFIQTDASINPGNSGGALVDTDGRLIGINAAILSSGGGNVGIGFAIPIDMVKNIADQLVASGRVLRGELGVAIQDLTPSLAQAMGVSPQNGVVVAQVLPSSAAAAAGVQQGDIITKLNGQPLADGNELRNTLGAMKPGARVQLELLRNAHPLSLQATLQSAAQAQTGAAQPSQSSRSGQTTLGLTVAPVPADQNSGGTTLGAYVAAVAPGSAADNAGIREGDIITSAARQAVTSPTDLARIIRQQQKRPMLLTIRRRADTYFVAVS